MENEMPTTQLVQLYGREFDVALSQAITKLIRAREWLDVTTYSPHLAKADEQIQSASKIITDIAKAIRREIARIGSEWWTYDNLEDVRSYRLFLNHLLDRSLYNNTEKEPACQPPPSE